jgi:hypothetical protein
MAIKSLAIWSPMFWMKNKVLLDKGYQVMTDPVTGNDIIYSIRSVIAAFNNPALSRL